MRYDVDRSNAALRLTLGRWTTQQETEQAADQIADAAQRITDPVATIR